MTCDDLDDSGGEVGGGGQNWPKVDDVICALSLTTFNCSTRFAIAVHEYLGSSEY